MKILSKNTSKTLDFFLLSGYNEFIIAGVVELADALDSKSCGSDTVSVRPRSPAPKNPTPIMRGRVF